MEEKIEFRQVRDFGQLINDTFVFVKQNFKPLFKAIIIICGFFMVAHALTSILYTIQVQQSIGSGGIRNTPNLFNVAYFINIFITILFYTSLALTVFSYIGLYVEKGNEAPHVEELWSRVKYYFLRVLTSGVLLFLLTIVGFILCIVPGIYLFPITSLIIAVMIFENGSLSYSFDRGFKLIKEKWWITFGAMFIIIIVIVAASMIVILPVSFIASGSLLLDIGRFKIATPVLIITTLFGTISQLFMALTYIVTSLCYFSLVEDKEGAGLMDKIDMIGQKGSDEDLPEEQY